MNRIRRGPRHHNNSNGGHTMKTEDRRLVIHYLNNVLQGRLTTQTRDNLWRWAERHSPEVFNINLEALGEEEEEALEKRDLSRRERARREDEAKFRLLKMTTEQAKPQAAPGGKGQVGAITEKIADSFRLKDAERDVLRLFVGAMILPVLDDLMDDVTDLHHYNGLNRRHFPAFALLLGCPPQKVEQAFDRESPLVRNGLFCLDSGGEIEVSEPLKKMVNQPGQAGRDIKNLVLAEKAKASLTRANFEHLAGDFDHMAEMLGTGLKKRDRALNILLYGPPGTGKTEMAKTLAATIKADLYPVSETLAENRPEDRRAGFLMALTLMADEPKAMLLLDEAEDLFSSSYNHSTPTKLFFNRLLENNETPVIWITNHIRRFDKSHLRRFSFLLEVKTPPIRVRARIWQSELAKNKVKITPKEIDCLAKNYNLAPSCTTSAIRAAKLVRDKKGAIERTLNSLEYAMTGRRKLKDDPKKAPFNPALLNTDRKDDSDLTKLTRKLSGGQDMRFSLCLFGAPGTGKSEYVRHLAERMGLEVLHKRASDLLDCWVGESEKNIAAAFQEAVDDKKILIIDEADSLLHEREQAVRSWEVTQVNEMLTWMERHPYPFACTTNLMDRLDKASLRRFTFKVKFDYLTPAQARLAFRHFFGQDFDLKLEALTPGDFAVVARQAAIMGLTDPAELAGLLAQEQEAKGIKSTVIGF